MPIPTNQPMLDRYGVYPWADKTFRKSDLLGANYETLNSDANGFGDQATFDVLTDGNPSRGLRVTIQRGANRQADESNGYDISVTVGSALSVALSGANRTVTIVLAAATTMAQLKTAVDNITGLNSTYFGGETGAGATDAQEVPNSAGGSADQYAYVRIGGNGDGRLFIGTSAPSNDNRSIDIYNKVPYMFRLPAGREMFFKRAGTDTHSGYVEIWLDGTSP